MNLMGETKIVFCGPMGAGKTTAIRAISEIDPVCTDVENTDFEESDKAQTTVALDYGETTLPDGEKLRLYGTPGQLRFEFMWDLVANGALGVVVLIDNSRPAPLADLDRYLDAFPVLVSEGRVVVGIGRLDGPGRPGVEDYADHLERRGLLVPVVPSDVRRRDDVSQLLNVLFHQIEVCAPPTTGDWQDWQDEAVHP